MMVTKVQSVGGVGKCWSESIKFQLEDDEVLGSYAQLWDCR